MMMTVVDLMLTVSLRSTVIQLLMDYDEDADVVQRGGK